MGKAELSEKIPEITSLINLILLHEYVPSTLTLSVTSLAPKKPPFTEPANHRPISVMTTLGRLVATILKSRMEDWRPSDLVAAAHLSD